MSALSSAIRDQLGPLLDNLGLRLLSELESSAFGNTTVELECPAYRMRIVRDRGLLSVDFASQEEPSNWYQLDRVLRALGRSWEAATPLALVDVGRLLEDEHARLRKGLISPEYANTRRTLDALGKRAERDLLRQLHGEPQHTE